MKIQESAENYLETIYTLHKSQDSVRSVDIARALDYSKPSVSRAMKLLRENHYITIDTDGAISLTETGLQVARNIYERHMILSRFLQSIGVAETVAFEDACRIEHVISQETFERLRAFVDAR